MKMMDNDEIQNDVNSLLQDATSGNQENYSVSGDRQQATSREEDPAQRRRKWKKEENAELWKCFTLRNPHQRGYRKRMTNIWHERGNHQNTEQRLADQIRAITKRNWLTETEREEIQRDIENQEVT